MAPKHFNLANIFGLVVSTKTTKEKESAEDKGIFCVDVVVDCHSKVHGKPRVFVRIYGSRGQDFLDWYKKNKEGVVKFKGFYSQNVKDGKTYSNFVAHSWEARPEETPRVGFVLVGELTAITEEDGEKAVGLHLSREKDSSGSYEEDFKLCLHPKDEKKFKDLPAAGATVNVEGLLCQMGEINYISDEREGDVKPYVKTFKEVGNVPF